MSESKKPPSRSIVCQFAKMQIAEIPSGSERADSKTPPPGESLQPSKQTSRNNVSTLVRQNSGEGSIQSGFLNRRKSSNNATPTASPGPASPNLDDQDSSPVRGPMWASRSVSIGTKPVMSSTNTPFHVPIRPTQEQRDRISALRKELRSGRTSSSGPFGFSRKASHGTNVTSGSTGPNSPNIASASAHPGGFNFSDGENADDSTESAQGQGSGLGSLLGGTSRRTQFAAEVVKEAMSKPLGPAVKDELEAAKKNNREPPALTSRESDHGGVGNGTLTPSRMKQIGSMLLGKRRDSAEVGAAAQQQQEVAASKEPSHQAAEEEQQQQGQNKSQLSTANARWGALKRRMSQVKQNKMQTRKLVVGGPDLTQELQSGILPVLLLKMAMERDETKHRRIPVLLNQLQLHIADSIHPTTSHAIFRIELEYGDGMVKWVVYRGLGDFINLHTHYRAAAVRGYLGRPVGSSEGDVGVPSFPRTSLPYLRQAKSKKAEFARTQREALETYLIELIRKTMFRPEANRLCKFFELSAVSVSLAARGGVQGKQGYLRILSPSSRRSEQSGGLLTPLRWIKSHDPKWFIVRESFIVVVEEPDSLQIYDVFLMDTEFEIIRPKRIYRQVASNIRDSGHRSGGGEKSSGGHGASESDAPAEGASDQTRVDGQRENDKEKKKKVAVEKDRTALLTGGQWRTPEGADEEEGEMDEIRQQHIKEEKGVSAHTFYIKNAQRKLKLVARNERQMQQFIASMESIAAKNVFGSPNRFGSFAPIRLNVNAKWLVDGRDYFWNLSEALLMAKNRIFIHDWWLSPELYLRRPGKPKWRLDNILKKKAEEGVKIFVILYNEVSNNFTPTDSNYTKQRLIGLHRNIYVQRSPSHFQTGTFYWAHHEKMCVIDETIAFMGGLDLCFGRWDTPGHALVDDYQGDDAQPQPPTFIGPVKDGVEANVWPGQDYANERVMEWHTLSRPEEDLFPRDKFPRMPWHDTALQFVGQPARDLCRHFIQRWNYLLRIKNHSRIMPFLVPPPDFTARELLDNNLTGTCEVQICRSAGPWSLGTANKVEHSIQNAYLKAIQNSERFVYIENQFFITSTMIESTKVENQLGDALVNRIIRAHREGEHWRAIIVIPLIPGFPMPIDHPDASSVRIIVEAQYRSICRGEHSIFGRLRSQGIAPEDYISFFSLRTWGKLRGGLLTTEQLYIHGKVMIVDDRLALIGSANINERSQRGDRDSELACIVRDTDMIDSTMAGEPFKVGRFPHTLRVRLMREHLGIDVDEHDDDREAQEGDETDSDVSMHDLDDSDEEWDPDHEQSHPGRPGQKGESIIKERGAADQYVRTAADALKNLSPSNVLGAAAKKAGKTIEAEKAKLTGEDDNGEGNMSKEEVQARAAVPSTEERMHRITAKKPLPDDAVPTVEEQAMAEEVSADKKTAPTTEKEDPQDARSPPSRAASIRSSASAIKRKMSSKLSANPWSKPGEQIELSRDDFEDPIADDFYLVSAEWQFEKCQ